MNNQKKIFLFIGLSLLIVVTACNKSKEHPGYTYFPDMAYSQAYESFTLNPNFSNGMTEQLSVPGTIARGFVPFHYENNIDEYNRAGEELKNPLDATDENLAKGEHNFIIYCAICHGTNGEGDGNIVKREKFPPPPTYFNDYMMQLPEGKMFFTIHYGKGLMGSYASQLSKEERWQIILFVRNMQGVESGGTQDEMTNINNEGSQTGS
jgi:mono/diheme cytochrome c family protein